MPRARTPDGLEIEFETFGAPHHPALLLVMGLSAQLISWHESFCEQLASSGRHVIRFDNRDSGLSSKFEGVNVDMDLVLTAHLTDDPGSLAGVVPYTLADMAGDAFAVLDHLGIDCADVVGASMGGMIVQQMAIDRPERIRSLTSIMSMTGEPGFGEASPEAQAVLLTPMPSQREDYIEAAAQTWPVYMSRRHTDLAEVRARAARAYDRSFCPDGGARQLAAIVASGSRAEGLRQLKVPTLVIHGLDDTLIDKSGGQRTADLVFEATLVLVEDMGHDLPEKLFGKVLEAIMNHLDACADHERSQAGLPG